MCVYSSSSYVIIEVLVGSSGSVKEKCVCVCVYSSSSYVIIEVLVGSSGSVKEKCVCVCVCIPPHHMLL